MERSVTRLTERSTSSPGRLSVGASGRSNHVHITKHDSPSGPRWARDGAYLPDELSLERLLEVRASEAHALLWQAETGDRAPGELLAPVGANHEIWASGVTYLTSRDARRHESEVADVYEMVYDAERPELFLKSIGWRAMGPDSNVRVREDSEWNVPEPELVLVLNRFLEIVGYTIGNDVSSRSIEGANPLYLPQAKFYNGSSSIGPAIWWPSPGEGAGPFDLSLRIWRQGTCVYESSVSTRRMKRSFEELAQYLGRELSFPEGAFLMTGTGLVPDEPFTLERLDRVEIRIPPIGVLENGVC